MKKIFAFLIGIVFSITVLIAQEAPPQAFSYKATIAKSNGAIVANKTIGLKLSILQNNENGIVVYEETFIPTTNEYGQIDIVIGEAGGLSSIDWPNDKYFLKVGVDVKGGTTYETMSVTQLLSVPYALYAGGADYNNLLNKPGLFDGTWASLSGKPTFATVATSGSFADLLSTPTTLAGYGITDADNSLTNEIQALSIIGSNLTLSKGGGTVVIPGDNWGTQTTVTDATMVGNGTSVSPLKIAQQEATAGQVLKWSGSTWSPDVDLHSLWSENGSNIYYGNGNVGIGTSIPTQALEVNGQVRIRGGGPADGKVLTSDADGVGIWARPELMLPYSAETNTGSYGIKISNTATSGSTVAGLFENYSPEGHGVRGSALVLSGHAFGGVFESLSPDGGGVIGLGRKYGIYGTGIGFSGTNYGGYFESPSTEGIGIGGIATATSGTNFGGNFTSNSTNGRGVMGVATSIAGENYGGYFESQSHNGKGVYGYASAPSGQNYGGWFESTSNEGIGVFAGSPSCGVLSVAPLAGNFMGSVWIIGDLDVWGEITEIGLEFKGGMSFEIDHPLDPANKVLRHSFVESPDMMNVYNGNIITDGSGNAVVILPDYFEKLNMNFRYQLTVIGEFAQAIVAEKIHNNQFTIRTDKPEVEVSWQVTGVRNDPWAKENRTIVEEYKKPEKKGYYFYPEGYGQPENRSIMWDEKTKTMQEMKEKLKKGPLESQ